MISVVVPAYNEEDGITLLHQRLTSAAQTWQEDYEILVVNDGSRDRTLLLLKQLADTDPHVRVLSFSRNFGHQPAVTAGLMHARGDIVAVIDADLQDPPEELARFFRKSREGYDVVYAIREKRKESLFKRVAYHTYYRMLRSLANVDIPLDSGDFCVLSRRALDTLNALPERNRFIRGLRTWIGFRQIGVAYERQARVAGRAKYTFRGLLNLGMDGVINFSYKPLRIIGLIWMVVALISLVAASVFLVQYLTGVSIGGYNPRDSRGWTSLILAILSLSALQLLGLGVMGEYIGRLFEEAKRRPPYIVDVRFNFSEDSPRFPVDEK